MPKRASKLKDLTSLIGRTVTKIELNQFKDGNGGNAFNPVIHFDDGQYLYFVVQETAVGEYGVNPYVEKPNEWKGGK